MGTARLMCSACSVRYVRRGHDGGKCTSCLLDDQEQRAQLNRQGPSHDYARYAQRRVSHHRTFTAMMSKLRVLRATATAGQHFWFMVTDAPHMPFVIYLHQEA